MDNRERYHLPVRPSPAIFLKRESKAWNSKLVPFSPITGPAAGPKAPGKGTGIIYLQQSHIRLSIGRDGTVTRLPLAHCLARFPASFANSIARRIVQKNTHPSNLKVWKSQPFSRCFSAVRLRFRFGHFTNFNTRVLFAAPFECKSRWLVERKLLIALNLFMSYFRVRSHK